MPDTRPSTAFIALALSTCAFTPPGLGRAQVLPPVVLEITRDTTEPIDVYAAAADAPLDLLCTAPCASALRPGVYDFALQLTNQRSAPSRAVLRVVLDPGRSLMRVSHVSRSAERLAGWILAAVGIGACLVAISAYERSAPDDAATAAMVTATLSGAVVLGVGVSLTLWDDHWHAEVAR